MARRVDESDLLDWIEGVPIDPVRAGRLEASLGADPSLRRWAEEARRDRELLYELWEMESRRAPGGLVESAMELAEHDILLGDAPVPFDRSGARSSRAGAVSSGSIRGGRRPVRRLRVTPFRLVAAAGFIIIASTASLVGLFLSSGGSSQRQPIASAPRVAQAPGGDPIASTEASKPATEQPFDALDDQAGAFSQPLALTPPEEAQAEALGEPLARSAAVHQSRAREPDLKSFKSSSPAKPLTPLSFRLIHPIEHAPEHAVAPKRAAELAREGRLLVLIRASDPASVEASLLAEPTTADALDPRWRSVLELAGGASADGRAPGSDAARIALVDVLTTPEAMERLIASATAARLNAKGAWLQEMAEAVHLEPRPSTTDLLRRTMPVSVWAPRAIVPVLIERVRPDESDASEDDPAPRP